MCVQMGELSFDFAEGLVVGLGIDGKEKRTLAAKWQEFTKNAFTFTVRPASMPQTSHQQGTLLTYCWCNLDWDMLKKYSCSPFIITSMLHLCPCRVHCRVP